MTTTDELLDLFRAKLEQTGSLDKAFLKSVWVAYQRGLEDGRKECEEICKGNCTRSNEERAYGQNDQQFVQRELTDLECE